MPLRRGQKLAGGDCLDALAEAHIVGQKGLFTLRDAACRRGMGSSGWCSKSKFTVPSLTSARNAARLFAQTLPAQTVEPWRELARHPNPAADIGGRNRSRGNERLNLAGAQGRVPSVSVSASSQRLTAFVWRRSPARHSNAGVRGAATIQEDVEARIAAGSGLTEHPWSVFSDP